MPSAWKVSSARKEARVLPSELPRSGAEIQGQLLQFGVLRLGLLQDGDVGVIDKPSFWVTPLHRSKPRGPLPAVGSGRTTPTFHPATIRDSQSARQDRKIRKPFLAFHH
jgi:hypothetical protein